MRDLLPLPALGLLLLVGRASARAQEAAPVPAPAPPTAAESVAAPAALAPEAFPTPRFWNKLYAIPSAAESASIQIRVKEPGAAWLAVHGLVEKAGGRLWRDRKDQAAWRVPPRELGAVAAKVRELGALEFFLRRRHGPPPSAADAQEIAYKRGLLEGELDALKGSEERLPAVLALVREQLQSLARLEEAGRSADKEAVLFVTFAADGLPPPPPPEWTGLAVPPGEDLPAGSGAWLSTWKPPFAAGFWRRTPLPACPWGAAPSFIAVSSSEPARVEASVRRLAATHGGEVFEPACPFPGELSGSDEAYGHRLWVSVPWDKGEHLARDLRATGDLVAWRRPRAEAAAPEELASVPDRVRQLERERVDSAALLEKAPNVLALVRDELARLGPAAQSLSKLQGMAVFAVTILPPR